MQKYLWITDPHFNNVLPWTFDRLTKRINKEKPTGVWITGDITNGLWLEYHLRKLAESIKCPIYFVMGNHEKHYSSLAETHDKVRKLCQEYSNLIWLSDVGVIPINNEVALIGDDGWYSASEARPAYIRFTLDWFLTEDFRKLSSMSDRINMWRTMANDSAEVLSVKLQKAIDLNYKTIYLLTHFPPYKEATPALGKFMEKFWVPYNTNNPLGDKIKEVMEQHKQRHITILCGHTHYQASLLIKRNIHCMVNDATYFDLPKNYHTFMM